MSIFSDAMSAGFDSIEAVGGEEITYSYDGQSITVTATAGRQEAQETGMGGRTLVANRDVDFLIRPSALVIDSVEVEPKRGNLITRADGSRFRVFSPTAGPCWRYSDASQTYYRIQTVRTV